MTVPALSDAGGPPTILVVDDCVEVRRVTVRLLQRTGYAALGVAGVREALHTVRRHGTQITLVLSDQNLQDGTGVKLANQITMMHDIPVVLMSGTLEDIGPEARGLAAALLAKPFTRVELVAVVRDTIGPATLHPGDRP